MNIFLREMKSNRTSLILWCIGVLFMVATGMGKFTSLSDTGTSLNDLWLICLNPCKQLWEPIL